MSGLQFPDSARRAALQAAEDVQITGGAWASCALEAATVAAPHIVAAELRRLADAAEAVMAAGVPVSFQMLRNRAEELDGLVR